MKNSKSTNRELVDLLKQRNIDGIYDGIIIKALENHYHDFKSDADLPKVELLQDLAEFDELADVRQMVMDGEFDESPDEDDKADMRNKLPESMWAMMGLKPDQ